MIGPDGEPPRQPGVALARAVRELRPELDAISAELHANPETAFNEVRAHALLCSFLEGRGFGVARDVADLPTAFVATAGSGSPRVALIAEYDALPGLGHGCGHNLIAAGAVVAAAALRSCRGSAGSRGTLVVVGAPGEEGGGGKVLELERGVFDGLDAALMFHPADRTLPWRHARASAHLRVSYHGRAAHAAKNPEDGRSALAALIQLFVAVDSMRQYIGRHGQIHGVIRHGGDAPNVVPAYASADFLVREATLAANLGLVERFTAAARAAAIATGTSEVVEQTAPHYSERKHNRPLARRIAAYLEAQGVPVEQPSPEDPAGSSDIGNVSLHLPTAHPYLQIAPRGTPGHSEAMKAAAATAEARDAVEKMALALAQTATDLLDDPVLLEAARLDFAGSPADPA